MEDDHLRAASYREDERLVARLREKGFVNRLALGSSSALIPAGSSQKRPITAPMMGLFGVSTAYGLGGAGRGELKRAVIPRRRVTTKGLVAVRRPKTAPLEGPGLPSMVLSTSCDAAATGVTYERIGVSYGTELELVRLALRRNYLLREAHECLCELRDAQTDFDRELQSAMSINAPPLLRSFEQKKRRRERREAVATALRDLVAVTVEIACALARRRSLLGPHTVSFDLGGYPYILTMLRDTAHLDEFDQTDTRLESKAERNPLLVQKPLRVFAATAQRSRSIDGPYYGERSEAMTQLETELRALPPGVLRSFEAQYAFSKQTEEQPIVQDTNPAPVRKHARKLMTKSRLPGLPVCEPAGGTPRRNVEFTIEEMRRCRRRQRAAQECLSRVNNDLEQVRQATAAVESDENEQYDTVDNHSHVRLAKLAEEARVLDGRRRIQARVIFECKQELLRRQGRLRQLQAAVAPAESPAESPTEPAPFRQLQAMNEAAVTPAESPEPAADLTKASSLAIEVEGHLSWCSQAVSVPMAEDATVQLLDQAAVYYSPQEQPQEQWGEKQAKTTDKDLLLLREEEAARTSRLELELAWSRAKAASLEQELIASRELNARPLRIPNDDETSDVTYEFLAGEQHDQRRAPRPASSEPSLSFSSSMKRDDPGREEEKAGSREPASSYDGAVEESKSTSPFQRQPERATMREARKSSPAKLGFTGDFNAVTSAVEGLLANNEYIEPATTTTTEVRTKRPISATRRGSEVSALSDCDENDELLLTNESPEVVAKKLVSAIKTRRASDVSAEEQAVLEKPAAMTRRVSDVSALSEPPARAVAEAPPEALVKKPAAMTRRTSDVSALSDPPARAVAEAPPEALAKKPAMTRRTSDVSALSDPPPRAHAAAEEQAVAKKPAAMTRRTSDVSALSEPPPRPLAVAAPLPTGKPPRDSNPSTADQRQSDLTLQTTTTTISSSDGDNTTDSLNLSPTSFFSTLTAPIITPRKDAAAYLQHQAVRATTVLELCDIARNCMVMLEFKAKRSSRNFND